MKNGACRRPKDVPLCRGSEQRRWEVPSTRVPLKQAPRGLLGTGLDIVGEVDGEWDAVFQALTDFTFLEKKSVKVAVDEHDEKEGASKTVYNGPYQLQDDYRLALVGFPKEFAGNDGLRRGHRLPSSRQPGSRFLAVRFPRFGQPKPGVGLG